MEPWRIKNEEKDIDSKIHFSFRQSGDTTPNILIADMAEREPGPNPDAAAETVTDPGLSILTWNLNGLRSIPDFPGWLAGCGADIICLQETKVKLISFQDSNSNLFSFLCHLSWNNPPLPLFSVLLL